MARRAIHFSVKAETRAQILRELDLLRNCKRDNVIGNGWMKSAEHIASSGFCTYIEVLRLLVKYYGLLLFRPETCECALSVGNVGPQHGNVLSALNPICR